jgi:hypothetical protein
MKTSLVLDDALFNEAKKLAHESNRSIEKQRRREKPSL